MTFLCEGMVWGVDWLHLVWVGVGMKKPRGVIGSENMHFCYNLSHSEEVKDKGSEIRLG